MIRGNQNILGNFFSTATVLFLGIKSGRNVLAVSNDHNPIAYDCLYSPNPLEVGEKAETTDRVPRTKRERVDMMISS
jgi:hypothetical protein